MPASPHPTAPKSSVGGALDVVAVYLGRTLVALVVILGLCELTLAFFGPPDPRSAPGSLEGLPYIVQTRYLGYSHMAGVVYQDAFLGHRNMPNATYGAEVLAAADVPPEALGGYRATDLVIHTDAAGFVSNGEDDPPASARAPNERLVICFGGSTMVGWGAPPSESIPVHLQRLLSTPEAPVRVINAGVIAYHSVQEFLYFALELVHLRPDAVVFLDGFNDEYGREDDRRYLPTLRGSGVEPSGGALWLKALGTLTPRTARLLGQREGRPSGEHGQFLQRRREQYEAGLDDVLRAAAGVALANDMGIVLALQPDIYSKADAALSGHERTLLDVLREHDMMREERPEQQASARALYARLGEHFASQPRVAVLDLLGAFDDLHDTTYFDDGHYTPIGNARLAERIAVSLRAVLLPQPEVAPQPTSAVPTEGFADVPTPNDEATAAE